MHTTRERSSHARWAAATIAASGTLALAGCGAHVEKADAHASSSAKSGSATSSATGERSKSSESSEAEPQTDDDQPDTNQRGNIEVEVGDTATLTNDSGDVIAKVTVTSLEFEPCQDEMGEPGNPLVFKYTLETADGADSAALFDLMNPYDLSLYDKSSGVTGQGPDEMPVCLQKDLDLDLPDPLSPGSTYEGGELFPEAPNSGAVIYNPGWSRNGAEWAY